MARGLQELIDFLLNEVALCGNQGASLAEVLKYIDLFYNSPNDGSQRRQTADYRFQSKVWSWLTRNPEVSVGENNEFNHLTFDQVKSFDNPSDRDEDTIDARANKDTQTDSTPSSDSSLKFRIHVSRERTWYAVAGHEPDENKLPPSEFALLSIIATRKSNGISQIELVRLSGQDKRSVPKRTDALVTKGYIEKRAIHVRGARTSLLIHRQFLNASPTETSEEQATESNRMIDFNDFNSRLFETIRTSENGIIGRNDLKGILGFTELWYSRILSRAIRKWEQIGVMRRVRAESQYESMHSCVELLREPTQKDFDKFYEFSSFAIHKGEDVADPDDEMELESEGKEVSANGGAAKVKGGEIIQSGRIIPSWTPDRNVSNQLFDIINNAGTVGITNDMINRICFGLYYKRPSESLTHRLTDCWQVSQPPHLRHLALVRDSGVRKTIIHYVHYSARNFEKRVDEGGAFWEAVEFPVKNQKASKIKIPPVHAPIQVDENGFVLNNVPRNLMKNGNVSLFEGISSCKPPNYSLTRKDPTGVYNADGSYRIQAGITVPLENLPRSEGGSRKRGRPRKDGQVQSTTNGIKRETSASPGINDEASALETTPRRLPQSQKEHDKYKGMSKKERFEAMGWDETWTEYKALVMEKPTPGIYVTPHGKRRPAGMRQGRPKQSRIAVFKSPKLASLPWFKIADEDSDNLESHGEAALQSPAFQIEGSTPAHIASTVPSSPNEPVEPTPTRQRRGKRVQPLAYSNELATTTGSVNETKHPDERPTKRARLRDPKDGIDKTVQTVPGLNKSPGSSSGPTAVNVYSSETSVEAPVTVTANGEEGYPQTLRRDQTDSQEQRVTGPQIQEAMKRPMGPPKASTPKSRTTTVSNIPKSNNGSSRKHASSDRGGSIPFIRRKIIMDIVEKAGGAYPSGIELWYAFATAWMKLKYKEKPDTRTVNTTIKYLVDAGKLRQLTFSGKDDKGFIVTKTILRKPDISPDEPLIKTMQSKLMKGDRDPKSSFSPHVETNPNLSKHSHGIGRFGIPKPVLPTVSGSTVRIHSKPAFIREQEKRQERMIQKELLRRLTLDEDSEDLDDEDDEDHQMARVEGDSGHREYGIRRLMTFAPQSEQASKHKTQIFRPTVKTSGSRKETKKPPAQPKIKKPAGRPRVLPRISTTEAISMMMDPGQIFHPATGTFATGSIKRRGHRGKLRHFADTSSHINVGNPVRELTAIAQQPNEPISLTAKKIADAQRFAHANDMIMQWELEHEEMLDSVLEEPAFIEQTVHENFHAEPIEGSIRFAIDEPEPLTPVKLSPMRTRRMDAPRPSKRQRVPNDGLETRKLEQRPTRRRFNLRPLPEGVIRRYMVAIVAVRTLTGGIDGKIVDWELVSLAFPNSDPEIILLYGKSILARNRMEIHKMQHDFQERYLKAYEKDQVPEINYEDLRSYNWPALVEWASVELEFSTSEKAPTLPATREQFDSMFELREDSIHTAEELHATAGNITVINRRRLMGRMPFVVEQPRKTPRQRRQDQLQLEVVKTWVRANVTTPEDRYNAAAAAETLKPFGDTLLGVATQSLVTDRIICAANRGRAIPGRNYMMHDVFYQVMERRRGMDGDQLARAAEFKITVLDPAFEKDGVFQINYHAGDGDALAIEELFAHGYLDITPINPPREKFGLMDGGYLTRQMDKSRLRFEMEVHPRPSYKYGNPILDRINLIPAPLPPPSRHMPLWFDIHGCLIREWWMKSVGLVLGCIILRPGVSADSIAALCKPSLMKWEIELLLEDWLLKVGAVRKSESVPAKWNVEEWWWLVLGQEKL